MNRSVSLVLGGNVFGWTADRGRSFEALDAFVAHGGVLVDTSDSYSQWAPGNRGGESERVLGEWLAARPEPTPRGVIASARSLEQFESLVEATRLTPEPKDVRRLDDVSRIAQPATHAG